MSYLRPTRIRDLGRLALGRCNVGFQFLSISSSTKNGRPQSSSDDDKTTTTNVVHHQQHHKRLPKLQASYQYESGTTHHGGSSVLTAATQRILETALRRVILEPPTLHLMAASIAATLSVGLLEASLLCHEWPFLGGSVVDATTTFCLRYSAEQLFPSVVWVTQDAHLVATACGLDPHVVLRDLSGTTADSATLVLQTQFLATSRYFFAGFMMIAQLFRAGHISMNAIHEYEERIRLGQEPPLPFTGGLVIRLCGRDSHVSEVSLRRMGRRIFPVVEDPERVQHWLWKNNNHNNGTTQQHQRPSAPIYWCVSRGQYHSSYSWRNFPSHEGCLWEGINATDKILILEADATNGDDPLSIGEASLDLTYENAAQGFRRIVERFRDEGGHTSFRTLKIYLGNSLETKRTGGGHAYTIRQQIENTKEFDVLVDSRAPVLHKILDWCQRSTLTRRRATSRHSTTTSSNKKRKQLLLFQTKSRAYFLNLRALLREYGFEIYDPMDARYLVEDEETPPEECIALRRTLVDMLSEEESKIVECENVNMELNERLRKKFLNLPRIVHSETTAETVTAVESMILKGDINARNTAVIVDSEEGVASLENTLRQSSGFVQQRKHHWTAASWMDETELDVELHHQTAEEEEKARETTSGLEIICSSSIHDDVLRQVRLWARMGFTAEEIQYEVDAQFEPVLHQSRACQTEVVQAIELSTKEDVAQESLPGTQKV